MGGVDGGDAKGSAAVAGDGEAEEAEGSAAVAGDAEGSAAVAGDGEAEEEEVFKHFVQDPFKRAEPLESDIENVRFLPPPVLREVCRGAP